MTMTVNKATEIRAAAVGDDAHLNALIDCCLNAEAAFSMMGCKPVRGDGFRPVGVLTLMQIQETLARLPPERVALVKASLAFACEFCGKPAETSCEDFWLCEGCVSASAGGGDGRRP